MLANKKKPEKNVKKPNKTTIIPELSPVPLSQKCFVRIANTIVQQAKINIENYPRF